MAVTKKRVNITLDPDIHKVTTDLLDSAGMDFSAFVELLCVRFVSSVRPVASRLEELRKDGIEPNRAEVKLLLMSMFTAAQLEVGDALKEAMTELDIIELDSVPVQPKEEEPIHTPKVTKRTKSKK